jgi:hypothetical protein
MSDSFNLLTWGPVSRTRRNHALEHATIQILGLKNPFLKLAGYSTPDGFWVAGDISTDSLCLAVEDALTRLRGGEFGLAVHPNCGTNFVASGFLAGIAAWLGMQGTGTSFRRKLDRLPLVISLVTVVLILAVPLGPYLQTNVTTEPKIGGLKVIRIERSMRQNLPLHRIVTRG